MKKPKLRFRKPTLKEQLTKANETIEQMQRGYTSVLNERAELKKLNELSRIQIGDLDKQLTWTKQMCQQLVDRIPANPRRTI